jgi:hypothetical protein
MQAILNIKRLTYSRPLVTPENAQLAQILAQYTS